MYYNVYKDGNIQGGLVMEELKKILGIKLENNIIEKAMLHTSYVNSALNIDNSLSTINKIKADIGKEVIVLIAKLFYLFKSKKSLTDINSGIEAHKIAELFYDKYNIKSLVKLSSGENDNGTIKYIGQVYVLVYEIYLAHGYDKVYEIFEDIIKECECFDYKSLLQVYVQKNKQSVVYESIECGDCSNPKFKTKLMALGQSVVIEGSNKKENEKEAARQYCIKNDINLMFNQEISVGMIREKKTWNLVQKRRSEILDFEEAFGIGVSFRGNEYIFDSALTHVSYYNKKKNENKCYKGDCNKDLTFIGSTIFRIEVQRSLLLKYLDFKKINYKEYGTIIGEILKNSNLLDKINVVYSEDIYRHLRILNGALSDKTVIEVYKAVLGALLYVNFIYKNISAKEFQNYILDMVSALNLVDSDVYNYSSWLNDFKQIMELETGVLHSEEKGKDNEKIFSEQSTLRLDAYNLENIKANKKALSKIKLVEFYKKLREKYNITENKENMPKNEDINIFLSNLIKYTLKYTGFYKLKLKMIGGLLFNGWNEDRAIKLSGELTKRGLYNEFTQLLDKWGELYGYSQIKVIENPFNKFILKCESQQISNLDSSKDTLIEKNILIEGNKKFIREEVINKVRYYITKEYKCDMKMKLYKFNSNICPICGNNLDINPEIIYVISRGNKMNAIIANVSSCNICNISGLNEDEEKNIKNYGLRYIEYKGSPAHYISSIVSLKCVEVGIFNNYKENFNRNTFTPEQLERQLKLQKEIGLKGEQIILDYEKKQLTELGLYNYAQNVRWVAQEDCKAGYDILSFDESGNKKYIEVKSSTGNVDKFYMTKNEIETAERFGGEYYIYKVNNMMSKPFITKINDPYKLLNDGDLKSEATQYSVTFN